MGRLFEQEKLKGFDNSQDVLFEDGCSANDHKNMDLIKDELLPYVGVKVCHSIDCDLAYWEIMTAYATD